MDLHELLLDTFYFLISTLALVPLFKSLKLGSTLGYIVAGIIIGPMFLNLIDNSNSIVQLAEVGITLLLFMVGLELSPARLKKLRKSILIDGGLQMGLSTLVFTALGLAFGLSYTASFVIGVALSLSSTAFALSHMSDTSQLTLSHGQTSLSILLFQDLLIVPFLAILPILGNQGDINSALDYTETLKSLIIFSSLIVFCTFALKPAISFIKKAKEAELSLTAFLTLIIGMAIGMEKVGLSMPMGAFITGLFLANSEIKTNIKRLTLPFKGILMGLFFMTLGIDLDFNFIRTHLATVLLLSASIVLIKSIVLIITSRLSSSTLKGGIKVSLLISQAGEFGIVVLISSLKLTIIDPHTTELLMSSILLTMISAPFVARLSHLKRNQLTNHLKNETSDTPDSLEVSEKLISFPVASNTKIEREEKKVA